MSYIGIPTWVFQIQPRNSEAREPTSVCNLVKTIFICNSSRTKTLYNLIPKLPILNLDLLDWQGILLCLEL